MGIARRRETLGEFASAALPLIWKALARRDWNHSDFSRAIEVSTAQGTRILYGDRRPGRRSASLIQQLFPKVKPLLWDKPCPPSWKPHDYPDLRRQATGTDG